MLKSAIIVMFVVSIFLQSGFVAVHTICKIRKHKAFIKSIVKEQLNSGKCDADLVAFTEDELKNAEWEHSKEFFLGHDKFDVVRTSDSGGIKIYHCINDKKEKELFRALDNDKRQKTLMEDVIKKFCLNIHESQTLALQRSGRPITHSDYFSGNYNYGFTQSLFRPPGLKS